MEASRSEIAADRGETRMGFGWNLAKVAWRLLRSDRTLIALGLCAALGAGFATFAFASLGRSLGSARAGGAPAGLLVLCFLATLAGIFFQVALASAADSKIDGLPMTWAEALADARERFATIAAWAAILAAVIFTLSFLAQELSPRLHFFLSLAGAAWGFATIFVVPMLALDLCGPVEALREAPHLLRQRWGEEFAGGFGIGGVFVLAAIPAFIAIAAGASRNHHDPGSGTVPILLGAAVFLVLAVLASAVYQVFAVALYRDATIGFPDARSYVERRPRRRSWIVRIGLTILAGLLVLGAIGAIFGPLRSNGDFRVSFPASDEGSITAGMPVVYGERAIGEVTASEVSGERVIVSFDVESAYRSLQSSTAISLAEFDGRPCLVLVDRGEAPPAAVQDGPV